MTSRMYTTLSVSEGKQLVLSNKGITFYIFVQSGSVIDALFDLIYKRWVVFDVSESIHLFVRLQEMRQGRTPRIKNTKKLDL